MLTATRLRECLRYDPDTGEFHWNVRVDQLSRWNRRYANTRAGRLGDTRPRGTGAPKFYRAIQIDGIRYYEHRLALLYVTGEWPVHQVDHVDGDGKNNRFCNLREAAPWQNQLNRASNVRSISGRRGVLWDKRSGKWIVRVRTKGRTLQLGTFLRIEEADRVSAEGRRMLHGEFAKP